jgi:hypothetical protein
MRKKGNKKMEKIFALVLVVLFLVGCGGSSEGTANSSQDKLVTATTCDTYVVNVWDFWGETPEGDFLIKGADNTCEEFIEAGDVVCVFETSEPEGTPAFVVVAGEQFEGPMVYGYGDVQYNVDSTFMTASSWFTVASYIELQ